MLFHIEPCILSERVIVMVRCYIFFCHLSVTKQAKSSLKMSAELGFLFELYAELFLKIL